MMTTASLLFCAVVLLSWGGGWGLAWGHFDGGTTEATWEAWKEEYGKQYSSVSQERERGAVWQRNVAFIKKHNSMAGRTFDVAMNEFGDQMMNNLSKLNRRQHLPITRVTFQPSHDAVDLPKSVDWRSAGIVTPVCNQGQMGSSVAFAAADAVSSLHAIQTGVLATLSAEELQDCCKSHFPDGIFDCIDGLGGLCKADKYGPGNGTCHSSSCPPFAQVSGGRYVTTGNESALAEAVAFVGPVMVTVDASQPSFQLYQSGVYTSDRCSRTQLDHSMLVVGYGRLNGNEYWICKNSWGTSWGIEGYILMARNRNNMCGIASDASYPV